METTHTVDESVGAVEICVNLTQPMIDILDEQVNVFVIDNSSSVYIPPGAPPASESSHKFNHNSCLLSHSPQLLMYLIFSVCIACQMVLILPSRQLLSMTLKM